MKKPNFGECQIQQCLNTEFTLWALRKHMKHINAAVPTLATEKVLGWDSGFFFPWLPYVPLADQYGCNFFLQYKLSTLVEGTGGGQYRDWRKPYFRFKIPHEKKINGRTVHDFHQYEALRALAGKKCEVYYATNQVTTRDELLDLAGAENLIDNTPFLDVRDVTQQHCYATFTVASDHFLLHSEPIKAPRVPAGTFIERIVNGKPRSLTDDNEIVFDVIREQLDNIDIKKNFIMAYERAHRTGRNSDALANVQLFVFLRESLVRYFDIVMMRFWKPMV